MKTTWTFKLSFLLFFLFSAYASAQSDKAFRLRSHGVSDLPPEHVLPANQVLHARVNDTLHLLENIERFVVDTVPEEVLPPEVRGLMAEDHPLLAFLGIQMFQTPLTGETLRERTGLDPQRPITCTVYAGDPSKFFILSLPVHDLELLTAFINQAIRPDVFREVAYGGRTLVHLRCGSFGVYLAVAPERIYISAEPALLLHLFDLETYDRMSDGLQPWKKVSRIESSDVMVTLDPGLLKPIYPQIRFFKFLPVTWLHQWRNEMLGNIPTPQRTAIDRQIQIQLGLEGLDVLADYAECVLVATYEGLVDGLIDSLQSLNGLTVAVRLDQPFQEAVFAVHSDNVEQAKEVQPIPLAGVMHVLDRLPGMDSEIQVTGRHPAPSPAPWITHWLQRIRDKLESRDLETAWVESLQTLHREYIRPQPVESRVPWVVKSMAWVHEPPDPAGFDHLNDYFEALCFEGAQPFQRQVTIVPGESPEFLREWMREQQEARTLNKRMVRETLEGKGPDHGFLTQEFRMHAEPYRGPITRLVTENSLKTRSGFFGFNEHELVNRRIYFARRVDDLLVFHQTSDEGEWLENLTLEAPGRGVPAVQRLLEHLPDGANRAHLLRLLHHLPEAVDWLDAMESLIHRELNLFLEEVRSLDAAKDNDELARQLRHVELPPLLYSLNRNTETGELYALLPGNLVFPRPPVVPIIQDVLAGYRDVADSAGGAVCYTRVVPGTWEGGVIVDTAGLSRLIRTAGNRLSESYLGSFESRRELQHRLVTARDFKADLAGEIILRNPAWNFLPAAHPPHQPEFRPVPPTATTPPRPAVQSRPGGPIPPRDPATPAACLDLSSHYNGSLDESWQQGGMANNDLWALPRGRQQFHGTVFDVRGVIQLAGRDAREQLSVDFPEKVENIRLERPCRRLHFFHATAWPESDGTRVGEIIIHYADGESMEIPIRYGWEVSDWWTTDGQATVRKSQVAWKGRNRATAGAGVFLQLYKSDWENPRPDVRIDAMDYRTTMSRSAPFLIAVTAE